MNVPLGSGGTSPHAISILNLYDKNGVKMIEWYDGLNKWRGNNMSGRT